MRHMHSHVPARPPARLPARPSRAPEQRGCGPSRSSCSLSTGRPVTWCASSTASYTTLWSGVNFPLAGNVVVMSEV
jgi:hypothetical protein